MILPPFCDDDCKGTSTWRDVGRLARVWVSLLILVWGASACLGAPSPTGLPSATPLPSPTPTLTSTVVWFPPTATPTRAASPTALPPTPDLRPGLGEILLQDDFAAIEPFWPLNTTAAGSLAQGEQALTIAINSPRLYLASIRNEPVFDNFYVEITASPSLCRGKDEYGLLVRAQSPGDFYRFSLNCDGEVRLDRVVGGQASSPQTWMLGTRVPVGAPSSSRLAVWAVGKELRFFVNDEFQFSIQDPLLPSGRVGVFARSAADSPLSVAFSDLIVRQVIK